MKTMESAAERPTGSLDNAVMFHAQLHKGQRLLKVIGMAQRLGNLQTAQGEQPEIFAWQDASGDRVECTFQEGRLTHWNLQRMAHTP
jgi:hypothetical protein